MKLIALLIVFSSSITLAAKKATIKAPPPATPASTKKPVTSPSSSSSSNSSLNSSSTTFGSRLTADDPSKVAKGFRMMLVVPAWEGVVDRSGNNEPNISGKANASEALGLFVGYADMPIQRLGWLAGATVEKAVLDKENFTLLRTEMNLTYGFNRQIYSKWGANLHKFTTSPIDLSANVGLQAGLGLQLNRTLGAELALLYMTQKGSKNGFNFDTKQSGIEIAVTGTF